MANGNTWKVAAAVLRVLGTIAGVVLVFFAAVWASGVRWGDTRQTVTRHETEIVSLKGAAQGLAAKQSAADVERARAKIVRDALVRDVAELKAIVPTVNEMNGDIKTLLQRIPEKR